MPIIWHYVTKTYLKIFLLSLVTFFGLSFILKQQKLTLLIVSGATYKQAIILSLCMLVISLPHVLSISTFLSSLLTSYKLNSSGEITSLRASGLSLAKIFAPIYVICGFLLLTNIFLVSELVPYSKLLINKTYLESQTINPLVLLRKNALPQLKNVYAEMSLNDSGSESKNVLVAFFNENDKKISLLLAESLNYTHRKLKGKNVSHISHIDSNSDTYDHLIIDNQLEISTPESFFISILDKSSKARDRDVLSPIALLNSERPSAKAELFQRTSKIIAPFSLTLLGISAGLFSRKRTQKKNLIFLFLSMFGYFSTLFALKNSSLQLYIALFYTLAPHALIIFFSLKRQKKLAEGNL